MRTSSSKMKLVVFCVRTATMMNAGHPKTISGQTTTYAFNLITAGGLPKESTQKQQMMIGNFSKG